MGRDGREQALVINWNEQVMLEGFLAGADALRNVAKGFANRALTGPKDFGQIPELAERGRARLEEFMAMLDGRLADSPYVALDRLHPGGHRCIRLRGLCRLDQAAGAGAVAQHPPLARGIVGPSQRNGLTGCRPPSSVLRALEDHAGVGAAETEIVAHDRGQVGPVFAGPQYRQAFCLRIQLGDVGRAGDETLFQHQQAMNRFLHARGAQRVSAQGLARTEGRHAGRRTLRAWRPVRRCLRPACWCRGC